MNLQTPGPSGSIAAWAARPFSLVTHLIVGVAVALVSPLTALAWPFAILVGIVIGRSDTDRLRGEAAVASNALRLLAVTGGVLGMLFFGAVVGGLIAFVVVALAAFSERAAADASPTDRGLARIVLFVVPLVAWFAFIAVGGRIDININF